MESLRDRYRRLFDRGRSMDRLVFFSDAVFAIALTLLVIDIKVPIGVEGGSAAVVLDEAPSIYAYALSFYVIAVNWMGHHRRFAHVQRFDGRLIGLNFLLLFMIAFVPFPTSLIAEYGGEVTSVVLYAGVVASLNLLQLATWAYAHRAGHLDRVVDLQLYRYMRFNLLGVPLVFGMSVLIAVFWDPWMAMWSWFALVPVEILFGRLSGGTPATGAGQAVTSSDDSESSAPGTSLK
jgi:uncharacterized membrane protein